MCGWCEWNGVVEMMREVAESVGGLRCSVS